jgi:hypothetical protein
LNTPADRDKRLPLLLGLIVLLSLYRLAALRFSGLDLYVDEAQYWTWAQHLDWGYFSKPPVIAAVIAATTAVCGDGETCVKSGALVLYPMTTLLLWAIARRLFDARTAFWTAVVFITLPGVSFSSMIISTDVPLFFSWALALWAYLKALVDDRWHWWLLAGLAAGLGLMTKYTMLIFAISVFLHLAVTPSLRHHFRNPKLYATMALAALIFIPNVIWNAEHGWPTLRHTEQISGLSKQQGLNWKSLGDFLGGQFGLFGPILLLAWIAQLVWKPRTWWADPRYRMLACFALPFLAGISAQALLGRANANWAAMTYATATVFVVARLLETGRCSWLIAGLAFNVLAMLLVYHYDGLVDATGAPRLGRAKLASCWRAMHGSVNDACADYFKRVHGWDAFGHQLATLLAQHPGARLLGDSRDTLAEAIYYARPAALDAAKWNPHHIVDDHYALTTSIAGDVGRDFIFVSRDGTLPAGMAERFTSVEPLTPINISVHPDWKLDFSVWLLHDFRGYATETRR